MHSSPHHHRHISRWRTGFLLVCLLTALPGLDSAPTGADPKTPTLERLVDSPKDSFTERVGSPIELAWQAWLILSKSDKGALLSEDPATLVRRITPKSIFIAPQLNSGCSGQNYDENRCKYIKTINVNTSLQRKFLLDRLNAMHVPQKPAQEEQGKIYDVAGPFQLNIPLSDKGPSSDDGTKVPDTPKPEVVTTEGKLPGVLEDKLTAVLEDKLPAVLEDKLPGIFEEKFPVDLEHKPVEVEGNLPTTVKVVKKEKEKEPSYEEAGPAKVLGLEESLPEHVPVVDFIHEEGNDSFTDSVVDYKIPTSAKRVAEQEKKVDYDEEEDDRGHPGEVSMEDEDEAEQQLVTTTTTTAAPSSTPKYASPTLIVLFDAPTKAPSSLDDMVKTMENSTGNWTSQEFLSSIIPVVADDPVNATPVQDAVTLNATHEAPEDLYSDEEPSVTDEESEPPEDYSTEDSITESTDDDFAETTEDELLKPGEAGMTIPIITSQPIDKSDWHDKSTSVEAPSTARSVDPELTPTSKPEDTEVNVSSEVSINGDFILETTLLDVNTEKAKNFTVESPHPNPDFVTVKVHDKKELPPEKEPEVVFSTSLQEPRPPQVRPVIVWGVTEETAKRQSTDPLKLNLGLAPLPKDEVLVEQPTHQSEKLALPDKFQPVPETKYPPVPETKFSSLPETKFPNLPETKFPTLPESKFPALPETKFPTLPETKLPTLPESKFPTLPETKFPTLSETKFQPIPAPSYKHPSLGFVRFPSYDERPHSSSYVRFPSDEVNSIHSLDFKPRPEFSSTSSTKSSVPFYQKQSLWHRGSARVDRQHPGFKQQHWSERQPKVKVERQLNLPDFWAKLGDATTSHGSHNEPHGGDPVRRSRFKPA